MDSDKPDIGEILHFIVNLFPKNMYRLCQRRFKGLRKFFLDWQIVIRKP